MTSNIKEDDVKQTFSDTEAFGKLTKIIDIQTGPDFQSNSLYYIIQFSAIASKFTFFVNLSWQSKILKQNGNWIISCFHYSYYLNLTTPNF